MSSAIMELGLSQWKDFCETAYLGHVVKFPTHISLIMIRYIQQRLYMKLYGQLYMMTYDWDRLYSVEKRAEPEGRVMIKI